MSTPESSRTGNPDDGTAEMSAYDEANLGAESEQRPEPLSKQDTPDLAVDTARSLAEPTPAEGPLEPDPTHAESVLAHTAPEPPAAVPRAPGAALPAPKPRSMASGGPFVPAVSEAPRTRWGGIIWGLVFLALAGIGFWSTTVLSADFLADIWLRITPLAVGAGMVLIVGAIALLCALVALARHLQRRSAAQRSPF